MPAHIDLITAAADDSFRLGTDGAIRWSGTEIAALKADKDVLVPAIHPAGADLLEPADRDRLVGRLRAWLDGHIAHLLGPLLGLRTAELSGHGRGLAWQLVDGLGMVPREQVRGHLNGLSQAERKTLRDLGVNFGRYALSVPAVARPEGLRLRALLWCVHHSRPVPNLPARRGRSVPDDPAAPDGFYPAIGHVRVGRRLIPIRLYDRLADAAASQLRHGRLTASPLLASYADLTLAELRLALQTLGYRSVTDADGEHFRPQRRFGGAPGREGEEGAEGARRERPRRRGRNAEGQTGAETAGVATAPEDRPSEGRPREDRPREDRRREGRPQHGKGNGKPRDGQQRDGKPRDGQNRDGQQRDGQQREGRRQPNDGQRQAPPRPRPREIDPDSPFAVLKQLTFGDRKS